MVEMEVEGDNDDAALAGVVTIPAQAEQFEAPSIVPFATNHSTLTFFHFLVRIVFVSLALPRPSCVTW